MSLDEQQKMYQIFTVFIAKYIFDVVPLKYCVAEISTEVSMLTS